MLKEKIITFLNLHTLDLKRLVSHQLKAFVSVDAFSYHLISYDLKSNHELEVKLLFFYSEEKPQSCFTPAQSSPKLTEHIVKISLSSEGELQNILGF